MALGRLITLDALGTLVGLAPPAPLLVAELRARDVRCSEAQAGDAIAREIAFYRANHDAACDAASLAWLRARCTEALRDGLVRAGADAARLPAGELQAALLASLRFTPYDEVPAALRALRAAGHRLVVVSNWDVSLHDMLRATGLGELVDGAISSAEAGAPKPAPAIFARAAEIAAGPPGVTAGGLHAGDSVQFDVAGAIAAGMRPVLVVRTGVPPAVGRGVDVVRSLADLAELAA